MKTLTFRGAKLAYDIEGKGFPVVLLHGFCADSRLWEDFKLDLLEEHYRVVTIDLPGFGGSAAIAGASIATYAEAVLAVLEEKKLSEVILIGHSMGGYTALALAALAPERLKGIGLFHAHPYADTEDKKDARHHQIAFIQRHGHQLYVKQLVPKLFPPTYAQTNPFDLDKIIHRAARYSEAGIIEGLKAMAERPDYSEVLKNFPQPVLFIVGEEDEAIPKAANEQQLALPARASIHVLEKVGHMGMIETRRKTQLMVRQFVAYCLG